jgi:hypothetical protein
MQAGRLTLQMADSTGLVKTAILVIKGLQPGAYEVRSGATAERRDVKDALTLTMPMAQAKNISIQHLANVRRAM